MRWSAKVSLVSRRSPLPSVRLDLWLTRIYLVLSFVSTERGKNCARVSVTGLYSPGVQPCCGDDGLVCVDLKDAPVPLPRPVPSQA